MAWLESYYDNLIFCVYHVQRSAEVNLYTKSICDKKRETLDLLPHPLIAYSFITKHTENLFVAEHHSF